MMNEYRFEMFTTLIIFALSIVGGLILHNQTNTDNKLLAILIPIILALLLTILNIIISQFYKVQKNRESIDTLVQGQLLLSDKIEDIIDDTNKIARFKKSLSENDKLVKEAGITTLKTYLTKLYSSEYGFAIGGEYWSKIALINFWSSLVELQEKRSKSKGDNVIIRAIHSNDIELWDPKIQNLNTTKMYQKQEEFTALGGKIIRILIVSDDSKMEIYERVKKHMEDRKIQVYILKYNAQLEYDYLFSYEDKVIAKWFSGQAGNMISRCEIEDIVVDDDIDNWKALAEEAVKETEVGIDIPEDRNI